VPGILARKQKIAAQINEIINELPDDEPEIQGFKSYFQMLLVFINGDDYQPYMEKVTGELKEMFEKMRKKI
jgi:hypothetical protein